MVGNGPWQDYEAEMRRVIHEFYCEVFAHPVLSQFFVDVEQPFQEEQFLSFTCKVLFRAGSYGGLPPKRAHQHLMIHEDQYQERHDILAKHITGAVLPAKLKADWLQLDMSLKAIIVKQNLDQCRLRFKGDEIIVTVEP